MLWLTALFFLVEIVVGYVTNSMALIADSFHMLSDVAALVVAFLSVKVKFCSLFLILDLFFLTQLLCTAHLFSFSLHKFIFPFKCSSSIPIVLSLFIKTRGKQQTYKIILGWHLSNNVNVAQRKKKKRKDTKS